jgi:hypothetical protein
MRSTAPFGNWMVMMWVLAPSARAGTTEAAATMAAAQRRTAFTETCMIASLAGRKHPFSVIALQQSFKNPRDGFSPQWLCGTDGTGRWRIEGMITRAPH